MSTWKYMLLFYELSCQGVQEEYEIQRGVSMTPIQVLLRFYEIMLSRFCCIDSVHCVIFVRNVFTTTNQRWGKSLRCSKIIQAGIMAQSACNNKNFAGINFS